MLYNIYNKVLTCNSVSADSLHKLSNDELTFNSLNLNLNGTIIVDFLMLIATICAIFTIISKNPIISVLFLIGLYISVASYIILIGLQFIGLSYILIYVGAISILFIFILMLINIRISELQNNSINSVSLIFIIAVVINSILNSFPSKSNNLIDVKYDIYTDKVNSNQLNFSEIFNISNIKWDSSILEFTSMSSLGNTLYTDNFIIFIEASLILLLAMIGAIVITIKPSIK